MGVFAAVMTGKGVGAISTIQLFGRQAQDIIKKIFKTAGAKAFTFETGKILVGQITDGAETIDQVTIGCEGPDNFAIHCHGNPLIVTNIMRVLSSHGAKPLATEQMLAKILTVQKHANTIALEVKLAVPKAKTIEGTKIILNQIDAGLSKKATDWLREIDNESLDEIKNEAERILQKTKIANLIIKGCMAAIAGPPNTGKSTLLNCLCGRSKAIVTEIEGTTRDYVTATCQIGPVSVELVDTAGLDQMLAASSDSVDKESQRRAVEFLEKCDLILLVLDNSQTECTLNDKLIEKIADKKVLTLLNKSDLPAVFDAGKLPPNLAPAVKISAKFDTGIEDLKENFCRLCGVADFDLKAAVCITSRQETLLEQLCKARSKDHILSVITELLNGQLDA